MKYQKILSAFFIGGIIIFSPLFASPTSANTVSFSAKVSTDVLNVRKGPGTTYAKTSQLKNGAVVKVYEQKNGWDRISTDQKWIMDKYVKKITAAVKAKTSAAAKPAIISSPKNPKTPQAVSTKPSAKCLQAIKEANSYCKSIASGCNSYNTSARCVEANNKCAGQQEEALALCPV